MSIETRTKKAGKTYAFTEDHEKGKLAQFWFQHPPEGLTLFLVLYTQACRWSKCLGCNLPSKMSEHHVPFSDIMMQIDYLFNNVLDEPEQKNLKKIILSNNGSVLDEATFSTTALMYFIAKMNMHCPALKVLSIETRVEYIDLAELEVLSRALQEKNPPTQLEIAVGFEAFDETIRNEHFNKGLTIEEFEAMAAMLASYRYHLKVYFMMKPVPQMTEEAAIHDIEKAIQYLDKISEKHGIPINMHLNPTYVASGTPLAAAFEKGDYSPPLLQNVIRAVLAGQNKRISIYVGLNDEGLAVPGGSFLRPGDETMVQQLEKFNQTQDYRLLT
ncbi:MAG: hypothetical protein K8S27_00790 [Candidatus Omnitrophica bacterium]|nr:hypothetical protein [Candidatus Omnitrophota bacterium]